MTDKKKGKLIIFSAPSGAGKTTIVNLLLEENLNLEFSVSATSRKKRAGEEHSQDYYFLSREEFESKINSNDFLEWEEVYAGNYYGTPKSELQRIWDKGKHVVFDVDVVGGLNIKKMYPEISLSIFVKPPSLEILEQRLRHRMTEDEESIQKRIEKAKWELDQADRFDRVIVNDDLGKTVEEVKAVIFEFLGR